MLKMLARRRYPRFPVQLPLVHRTRMAGEAGTGVGWTRNLSEGGACVELAGLLQRQAPLRIHLQTDRGPITMRAQVVWAGDPPHADVGVPYGVAFTEIDHDQRQALSNLVYHRGDRAHAGVRLPFELPVTCRRNGEQVGPLLEGSTRDASRGGLSLLLPELLPCGTHLDLTLHTTAGPLVMKGEVVWAESPGARLLGPPYRHGFQFAGVGWSTMLSLGLLLVE